ncbi:MAG: hypothetical protein H0V18_13250 [Pyrinomonadaceae bacterium]|nr:hypothetical protein [Pyrinomonadaceae bacterium]
MSTVALKASLALWTRRLKYRRARHRFYHRKSKRPAEQRDQLAAKWHGKVGYAETMVSRRRRELAARKPKPSARGKAVAWAQARVGIVEKPPGSNGNPANISRWQASLGFGRVPWCGIACAKALQAAGVRGVSSRLASVALVEDDARAGRAPFRAWSSGRGVSRGDMVVIGGRGVHVELVVERHADGSCSTIGGNCLAEDEPVLTPRGWVPIGNLVPGAEICDPSGGTAEVLAVHRRGEEEMFAVTLADGSTVRATADHLWTAGVSGRGAQRKWRTVTTSDLRKGNQLPHIAAQHLDIDSDRPLDSYLLGLLLGDGCISGSTPTIDTSEDEMAALVASALPAGVSANAQFYRNSGDTPGQRQIRLASPKNQANPVTDALIKLELFGCLSFEKRIPEAYLWAPEEDRLAVLQGLMDTDGTVGKDGKVSFSSSSRELAEGVQFLIRSLGGRAGLHVRGNVHYTSPTQVVPKAARDSYRLLNIRCDAPLFRRHRKAARVKPRSFPGRQWSIRSVEPAGRAQAVCIEVSSASRLYVTRDFMPTHNTSFGPGGSQSNGGAVAARRRSPSEIRGYALVNYPG